jgi:hypothetical protein
MKTVAGAMSVLALFAASGAVWSAGDSMGPFGEKVLLRVGGMYANQDTQLQLSGDRLLGVSVDLEDFFGLENELTQVAQFTAQGRFKEKHRIGAQYYAFNRSADSTLKEDWSGDDIEASAGASADTTFNIAVTDITYSYSFIRDSKHELAGTIGLFWMDIDIGIDLQGQLEIKGETSSGGSAEAGAKLAAPLPVFGLSYDYAINPKWLVGGSFKYFTLRTSKIDGSLVMLSANTRYYFWDHFEVGGGFSVFDLGVKVDTGDARGSVDWSFWGPQFFLGARF